MDRLKIFISSTMEELQVERNMLAEAFRSNPLWNPRIAETFIARTESPEEVCLDEVRNSHVYVGIFKNLYGYVPEINNPNQSSVTKLEYEEAIRNNLPILIFVAEDDRDRDLALTSFINILKDFHEGHWVKTFTDPQILVNNALESLEVLLIEGYVNNIEQNRTKQIKDVYDLPFFKKIKEKLIVH